MAFKCYKCEQRRNFFPTPAFTIHSCNSYCCFVNTKTKDHKTRINKKTKIDTTYLTEKGGHSIAIDSTYDWSKEWEYELRNREMDTFKHVFQYFPFPGMTFLIPPWGSITSPFLRGIR